MGPDKCQKIAIADKCQLAYEVGRQAFTSAPTPMASIWDTLTRLGAWRPISGQGRLLSVA